MTEEKRKIIEDLINWSALSELLTGNKGNIRRDRVPNKYLEQVNSYFNMVTLWYEVYIEGNTTTVQVNLKTVLLGLRE